MGKNWRNDKCKIVIYKDNISIIYLTLNRMYTIEIYFEISSTFYTVFIKVEYLQ